MGDNSEVDRWLLRALYICLIILAILFIIATVVRFLNPPA